MSEVCERDALGPSISLYEHARRLHLLASDSPLPDGGFPLPDHGGHGSEAPYQERHLALTSLLREFIDHPAAQIQDLHDRCAEVTFRSRDVLRVVGELAPEPSSRLGDAGRWLTRQGTNRCAVMVGLGLLLDNAAPDDADLVRTVGLLSAVDELALAVLARIPGAARDVVWLAERSRRRIRVDAVNTLAGTETDSDVSAWILSTPRQMLSSDLARKIAERCQIAEMLEHPDAAADVWDYAGNLLIAMTSTNNYKSEISRYQKARDVYQNWITLADGRSPTVERAALLTMIAEDLRTGPAAPVVGELRGTLADRIVGLLTSPAWASMLTHSVISADPIEARRAAWVIEQTRRDRVPVSGFVIRVVVPDPLPVGYPQVEARIIIDGLPVVATGFDKGPAASPEYLIDRGRLVATDEPREVRLAEAYCTEGCCGGLYVTIVRDGSAVVWKGWRSSASTAELPAEVRIDAAAYEQEIARAENDRGWEWPARTAARLVNARLRDDPMILGRWDCALGWCSAGLHDFDAFRLTFGYPAQRTTFHDPSVQFGLVVDVGNREPEAVAAETIERLRGTDPKTTAEMIGGSKNGAADLGLAYRKPTRW